MRIKRALIITSVTALPLAVGFIFSSYRSNASVPTTGKISENHSQISPSDTITISSQGAILTLDSKGTSKITAGPGLINPVWANGSLIAELKSTNYSSIELFSQNGSLQKKLVDGSNRILDNNKWAAEPAVSQDGTLMAYVSDKNRFTTGVPDNELFLESLTTGKTRLIASPNAYTGGITNPRFNPTNSSQIAYSFYQYDSSNNPLSTIMLSDTTTGKAQILTTEKQNAYQQDFSFDGRKMAFLGRSNDLPEVTLYIADFNGSSLTNIKSIYTGDIAYPRFSFDGKSIYFLQAIKNTGYNLYKAEIGTDTVKNITQITSGQALNGDSSFEVSKK
jgi:Tol biopolymer transport system component